MDQYPFQTIPRSNVQPFQFLPQSNIVPFQSNTNFLPNKGPQSMHFGVQSSESFNPHGRIMQEKLNHPQQDQRFGYDTDFKHERGYSPVQANDVEIPQPIGNRRMCQFFPSGQCRNGNNCPYVHDPNYHPNKAQQRRSRNFVE